MGPSLILNLDVDLVYEFDIESSRGLVEDEMRNAVLIGLFKRVVDHEVRGSPILTPLSHIEFENSDLAAMGKDSRCTAYIGTHSKRKGMMISRTNEGDMDTLLVLPVEDPAGTAAWINGASSFFTGTWSIVSNIGPVVCRGTVELTQSGTQLDGVVTISFTLSSSFTVEERVRGQVNEGVLCLDAHSYRVLKGPMNASFSLSGYRGLVYDRNGICGYNWSGRSSGKFALSRS